MPRPSLFSYSSWHSLASSVVLTTENINLYHGALQSDWKRRWKRELQGWYRALDHEFR
jgi:hypothetical protein